MRVGERVLVMKSGWARFLVPKTTTDSGKEIEAPGPWYPHGKEAEVIEVKDCYLKVKTEDGKEWPYPIGFWAVSRNLDFYDPKQSAAAGKPGPAPDPSGGSTDLLMLSSNTV